MPPRLCSETSGSHFHSRMMHVISRRACQPDNRREPDRHGTAPFAHVRPTSRRDSAEAPMYHLGSRAAPCARVTATLFRERMGGLLGVPRRDKDEEIRVRTGKFRFQPSLTHRTASRAFSKTCVENRGFMLAPQVGFEPTTFG
jgi:hypothetical protein